MNEKKMAEGYQTLAQELKEFSAMAIEIAHEVIPEWDFIVGVVSKKY